MGISLLSDNPVSSINFYSTGKRIELASHLEPVKLDRIENSQWSTSRTFDFFSDEKWTPVEGLGSKGTVDETDNWSSDLHRRGLAAAILQSYNHHLTLKTRPDDWYASWNVKLTFCGCDLVIYNFQVVDSNPFHRQSH